MKTTITALTTALFTLIFLPQVYCQQGWERFYNYDFHTVLYQLTNTSDGGFAFSGSSGPSINPDSMGDALLVKIQADGKVDWSIKTGEDHLDEVGWTLLNLPDGSYISGGEISNNDSSFLYKTDQFGQLQWMRQYDSLNLFLSIIPSSNDSGYFLLGRDRQNKSHLSKVNLQGQLLWTKPYCNASYNAITQTLDQQLLMVGRTKDQDGIYKPVITKINTSGDSIWQHILDTRVGSSIRDVIALPDGSFAVSGIARDSNELSFASGIFTAHIQSDGIPRWQKTYYAINRNLRIYNRSIVQSPDGGFAILSDMDSPINDNDSDLFLVKTDINGNEEFRRTFSQDINALASDMINSPRRGYLIGGYAVKDSGRIEGYLIKTDQQGYTLTNVVHGQVFHDANNDCLTDNSEMGLQNWLLRLDGPTTAYTTTDSLGRFELRADSGEYTLEVIQPAPYWNACQSTYDINFTSSVDSFGIDIPQQAFIDCPALNVDISTPFLRRCFDNTYFVSYCNNGTIEAVNAYVEVQLDTCLRFINSSLPVTALNGQMYTFDLGNVPPNSCDRFYIVAELDCDCAAFGQTHCTAAYIYPDSSCLPPDPNWDGASIQLDGECQADKVEFRIFNQGADMSAPLQYIVIEDDVLMRQEDFQLTAANNNELLIELPANGRTYRLEAMQSPNHPGRNYPSITIEGCQNGMGTISRGFVNLYAQNDADPFISIDCQENRGSYDPNDKLAFPEGVSEEHCIAPGTDIEYLIRFQNTGTDTAFRVRIVDTLPRWLDISSIQPGTSSHPYQWKMSETGTLQFLFDPIELPDSNVNLTASNGFVKFRISQRSDAPLNSTISNRAAIYFDYNKPIMTPDVNHTIATDCIRVSIEELKAMDHQVIKIYPNPFQNNTTFELSSNHQQLELYLYDARGQRVRYQKSSGSQLIFQRQQLPSGLYFFELKEEDKLLGSGKILLAD